MTKRIVSGIFILTALGALGVILAGALTSGEQLIVRFLTAVIVAALGLYVISDLRLQADDDAMTARSTGHPRMATVDAPPNSTAAFMATVTRRSEPKADEVNGDPESQKHVAVAGRAEQEKVGVGATTSSVTELASAVVEDAESSGDPTTPREAIARPKAPETIRAETISPPPEISLSELFSPSDANGQRPGADDQNDHSQQDQTAAAAAAGPIEAEAATPATEPVTLSSIVDGPAQPVSTGTGDSETGDSDHQTMDQILEPAMAANGAGNVPNRRNGSSSNGSTANGSSSNGSGHNGSGHNGTGHNGPTLSGKSLTGQQLAVMDSNVEAMPTGSGGNGHGVANGGDETPATIDGRNADEGTDKAGEKTADEAVEAVAATESASILEDDGDAQQSATVSDFEYSDELQSPQHEWPSPPAKPTNEQVPQLHPFEKASAAYQAEKERLAAAEVAAAAAETDDGASHLPAVAAANGVEAADYADAPLAPIIDLREVNSHNPSSVDTAINAGEVEVIATLIEQGMLSTDGPISDRDVRTMVYVAFTSNELRKLLLAGGTPDGPNYGLDLGPVELFDERIHAPAPKTLYSGSPRRQAQSQIG